MKDFSELEKCTNELLLLIRDLEYQIQVFGEKCNATNSLKVRNLLKKIHPVSESFKEISIKSFKK